MGKTSLGTTIALNAAKLYRDTKGERGAKVGFFSLEMRASQISSRILSTLTGVPTDHVRKGKVSKEALAEYERAGELYSDLPIYIDDSGGLTLEALHSRARRMKRQHGIGLLIVDYLQLMHADAINKTQEITKISNGLKAIAKDVDVPVIALSQLSRQVELREDKRPLLSDLRESGSIEQDADIVMFIFREEYYLAQREPQMGDESEGNYEERHSRWQSRLNAAKNTADVIIAKHRHGAVGLAQLYFKPELTEFRDLDRQHRNVNDLDDAITF